MTYEDGKIFILVCGVICSIIYLIIEVLLK